MGSLLLGLLLCGMVCCSPVPGQEDKERGVVEDIIIGQIQNQINNLLGITTTRGTPVLDVVGGIIGGPTTTTQAPAPEKPVPGQEDKERGLVEDIIIGQIQNQ